MSAREAGSTFRVIAVTWRTQSTQAIWGFGSGSEGGALGSALDRTSVTVRSMYVFISWQTSNESSISARTPA
jgi:hypothetical protein